MSESLKAEDCIEHDPSECEGVVEYRMSLSPTGRAFPRCEKHWQKRLDWQEDHNSKYPDSDAAPSWFDPANAGERWNDDY